jgi:hypothetical protein
MDVEYFMNGMRLIGIDIDYYENFDTTNGIKKATILSSHLNTLIFDKVYVNYTIVDSFKYDDGLIAKYYSNNNF